MPSTHTLTAAFTSQAEQMNGYWLISYTLSDAQALPLTFDTLIDSSDNRSALSLFAQQGADVQFLAKQAVSIQQQKTALILPQKALKSVKNDLAWYSESALKNTKTLCFIASEDKISALFMHCNAFLNAFKLVAIIACDTAFPFRVKPAQYLFADLPLEAASMIGACALLEDWKIPNRLCHSQGAPGCFDGSLDEFLAHWQAPADWKIVHL